MKFKRNQVEDVHINLTPIIYFGLSAAFNHV